MCYYEIFFNQLCTYVNICFEMNDSFVLKKKLKQYNREIEKYIQQCTYFSEYLFYNTFGTAAVQQLSDFGDSMELQVTMYRQLGRFCDVRDLAIVLNVNHSSVR